MTIPNTIKAWLIVGSVAAAIILAFVVTLNRSHGQISQLQRSLEAEKLARDGEIVAHQQTRAALNKAVAEKLATDQDLAIAAAKLKLLQPDVQVVSAATLSTGAVVVNAEPEKATAPEGAVGLDRESHALAPPTEGQTVALAAPPVNPSTDTCVLRNGDPASITVNELTFKTSAGNYIPIGTATAWREGPGPRAKLFSHAFESSLSDASGLATPSLPRWGFGGRAVLFSAGAAAGPGIALPPARLAIFGHAIEIDADADALFGTLGAGLSAGAYVRF